MKVPVVNRRQMVTALSKAGFEIVRQRGSHIVMKKGRRLVTVPTTANKDLQRGTISHICKQSGLTFEELKRYL